MGNRYHYSIFIFKGILTTQEIRTRIFQLKSHIRYYSVPEHRFIQYWNFVLSYPDSFNLKILYLPFNGSNITVLSGADYESETGFFYESMNYFEEIDYSKLDNDSNLTVMQLGKVGYEYYLCFSIDPTKLPPLSPKYTTPFHVSRKPLPHLLQIFSKLTSQYYSDKIKEELLFYKNRFKNFLDKLKSTPLENSDVSLYNSLKFIGYNLIFDQTKEEEKNKQSIDEIFYQQVREQIDLLSTEYPEIQTHNFDFSNPFILGTEFCDFLKKSYDEKSIGSYSFNDLELLDHIINAIWKLMDSYQHSSALAQLEDLQDLKKSADPFKMFKLILPVIFEALKETQSIKEPEPSTFENVARQFYGKANRPLKSGEISSSFPLISEFIISIISCYEFFSNKIIDILLNNCEKILDQNESTTNSFDVERLLRQSDVNDQLYLMFSAPGSALTNATALSVLVNLIPKTIIELSDDNNWFIPTISSSVNSRFQQITDISIRPLTVKSCFWNVTSSLLTYWNLPIIMATFPYYRLHNDENYSLYVHALAMEYEDRRNNPFQYQQEYLQKMSELGLISKERVDEYQKGFKQVLKMFQPKSDEENSE